MAPNLLVVYGGGAEVMDVYEQTVWVMGGGECVLIYLSIECSFLDFSN